MFFDDYTELHLDTELVAQVILDFERSVWSVRGPNIKTFFLNLAHPLALDEEMQAELWRFPTTYRAKVVRFLSEHLVQI